MPILSAYFYVVVRQVIIVRTIHQGGQDHADFLISYKILDMVHSSIIPCCN